MSKHVFLAFVLFCSVQNYSFASIIGQGQCEIDACEQINGKQVCEEIDESESMRVCAEAALKQAKEKAINACDMKGRPVSKMDIDKKLCVSKKDKMLKKVIGVSCEAQVTVNCY